MTLSVRCSFYKIAAPPALPLSKSSYFALLPSDTWRIYILTVYRILPVYSLHKEGLWCVQRYAPSTENTWYTVGAQQIHGE